MKKFYNTEMERRHFLLSTAAVALSTGIPLSKGAFAQAANATAWG